MAQGYVVRSFRTEPTGFAFGGPHLIGVAFPDLQVERGQNLFQYHDRLGPLSRGGQVPCQRGTDLAHEIGKDCVVGLEGDCRHAAIYFDRPYVLRQVRLHAERARDRVDHAVDDVKPVVNPVAERLDEDAGGDQFGQ
ncbi:MAG TPA: hypothetical protein VKF40_16530 [Burkholderiales bacterium]|nr:hypothetical protein [Burkholderiales bacterium]